LSANTHLAAAALKGIFTGNRGRQPQSDVVEESRVPEVCLLQLKVDILNIFFNLQEAPNLETMLQKANVHIPYFLYCGINSPYVDLAVHFSFTLYVRPLEYHE